MTFWQRQEIKRGWLGASVWAVQAGRGGSGIPRPSIAMGARLARGLGRRNLPSPRAGGGAVAGDGRGWYGDVRFLRLRLRVAQVGGMSEHDVVLSLSREE